MLQTNNKAIKLSGTELIAVYFKWEQDFRDGKTQSAEHTSGLSVGEAATEFAEAFLVYLSQVQA